MSFTGISGTQKIDRAAVEAPRAWIGAGPKSLLIDGRWVSAASGKTLETIDPSSEAVLALLAEGADIDVDAAVAAAQKALECKSWAGISPHQRARYLLQIADLVDRHADELALIETIDMGMPAWFSTAVAKMAGETFRYYAGWTTKIAGSTLPTDASNFIYTLKEPVGVCGAITPWNVPLLLACFKIAPALACGNTIVVKPSEIASLSTLRLAELIQEADLPPGVLNVVTGFGPSVGERMANHSGIDKISFTGSTAVGKRILQASAGNLKRVTLELGGKSPNIIFPDADLDRALDAAVNGFTRNSGQICSSGTRIFVHRDIYDEVAERIASISAGRKVGDPFGADTFLGPVASATHCDRVMSYIDAGNDEGARMLTGGNRLSRPGFFIEPTVFTGVTNDMKIAREEIFGPVVTIIAFRDEDDAVFKGNDTTYGLAAGIWTKDVGRAHKVARALKAGRIWINTYGETDPVMPFGGFKQSGIGREFGAESIAAYTETKAVQIRF
ncbi:betaine-aldehyde dehydrogenase [Sphingobium sp. C100]|uniref:aldehyde dehydrogenase family protein n=1 Tax=Sphingobium sp. C100 TaxID=1207055 RepID=UPI0003D613AF|nr:aldehyde dehydrogenase family protein [Sphingobium sp. C100]ETI63445.1 betaine-aldehyde dehydrogenase [Sphingobium sp. C100]PHQ63982.1 MAG: betaine-aldehyde dehydrogenase [Sphingobium sp.]